MRTTRKSFLKSFQRSSGSFRVPHSSFRVPHSSFRVPPSAFRTHPSAFRTPDPPPARRPSPHHLHRVGRQKAEEQVGVGPQPRVAQHHTVHPCVIPQQPQLPARHRPRPPTVVRHRPPDAPRHAAPLEDGEEQRPVLPLTYLRHQHLLSYS